jgi:hypothetical protein
MTAQNLTELPVSSVPAAFDRGHLFSPTSATVADGIKYRPGDLFEPMPPSPRGNPQAWGEWWRTVAKVETPDYLGLRPGDEIAVQHHGSPSPGTVVSACRFGAVVRYPMPKGAREPYEQQYVTCRNQFGHWYR